MECPVCYNKISTLNSKILDCNHSLCISCINSLTNQVCPLCRASIREDIECYQIPKRRRRKERNIPASPNISRFVSRREILDMFRKPLWAYIR
jgi:hypothetical protein